VVEASVLAVVVPVKVLAEKEKEMEKALLKDVVLVEGEGLVVVALAVVSAGEKELPKDKALVEGKVLAVVVPAKALAGD
jgi:hypothetical protein